MLRVTRVAVIYGCLYCMDRKGYSTNLPHRLYPDSMRRILERRLKRTAQPWVITDLRIRCLTGGDEPLVRKGHALPCRRGSRRVRELSRDLAMNSSTGDVTVMPDFRGSLKEAGLQRVNIKPRFDFKPRVYRKSTRGAASWSRPPVRDRRAALDAGLTPVQSWKRLS